MNLHNLTNRSDLYGRIQPAETEAELMEQYDELGEILLYYHTGLLHMIPYEATFIDDFRMGVWEKIQELNS